MTPPHAGRLLIVEDNDTLRRGIQRALRERWSHVDTASRGDEAVERIADRRLEPYDVILSDLRLPGASGAEVLRAALERDARCAVVLMTAYGSIEAAVDAMRAGAFDFVQKPLDLEQIELRVERAYEHRRLLHEIGELRAERAAREAEEEVVAESPALRSVLVLVRRVAPTPASVLLTGETGTGKEVVARLIHRLSPRAAGPFVSVNCAALPDTLLESELFGHERGAFTGADRQRIGRFEQAAGGTLFLDEVGDTSPATQVKLLRVLQEHEFQRLGSSRTLHSDARIVAATNRDLGRAIESGRFREDLFFRLNVVGIHLPPLRERPEDVIPLAQRCLRRCAAESGRPLRGFSEAALARLRAYPWPGNVRELQNTIERAALMAQGARIQPEDLGLVGTEGSGEPEDWRPPLPPPGVDFEDYERRLLLAALEACGWVQKDAAARLGISRRRLNYMIQRMGIQHRSWRRNRARPARGELC